MLTAPNDLLSLHVFGTGFQDDFLHHLPMDLNCCYVVCLWLQSSSNRFDRKAVPFILFYGHLNSEISRSWIFQNVSELSHGD